MASLTIPTLINTYNAKVRETQIKKAYSVLSQANKMMVAQGIDPYSEFVLVSNEPETEEPEDTDDDSGETVQPPDQGGDSGSSGGGEDVGEEETPPSKPDINDETTKDLVDQIAGNILGAILGNDSAQEAVKDAYDKLVDKYGYNNVGDFLKDYLGGIFGGGSDDGKGDESNRPGGNAGGNNDDNDNPGSGGWWGGGLWNRRGFIDYKHVFAAVSEAQTSSNNYVARKKRQLEALKRNLSGAQYCASYNKCGSSSNPITYYNATGTEEAAIDSAEFENSALVLADGSIVLVGDENNSDLYFVDINGVKKPNRLGVDVFTFKITPKNAITPDRTTNCTLTGSPISGEAYRGAGCSGYALLNANPDSYEDDYWSKFK